MIPETSTVGVSFLTNAFKQFANKTVMECIKDGFPASFLRCMYPQAAESSINADVSTSEPGRSYLQATDGLGLKHQISQEIMSLLLLLERMGNRGLDSPDVRQTAPFPWRPSQHTHIGVQAQDEPFTILPPLLYLAKEVLPKASAGAGVIFQFVFR